ncbi:DUF5985 family protein [Lysobacter sp. N42]|jgi:hypothetical protein|uniref:DUF5985 family protein n=1 Tax=Lysobacter sp. N42 TaxID=2545719 RepID=UPI0010463540|nr:DUF5985 family protein [Lysobacter sp. N42]TCZ82409.1 hypothetical protein EYQ95_23025 [Lysobacter sp. N42]
MIFLIYVLCALTSAACAVLLHRNAHRAGSRMLFWCGLCFWMLTAASVLVILDHYVLTGLELWPLRHGTSLVAVALLLYGLIFEER